MDYSRPVCMLEMMMSDFCDGPEMLLCKTAKLCINIMWIVDIWICTGLNMAVNSRQNSFLCNKSVYFTPQEKTFSETVSNIHQQLVQTDGEQYLQSLIFSVTTSLMIRVFAVCSMGS